MMFEISVPIFLIDGFDIIIFTTVQDAENFIEPADVTNNDFILMDCEGNYLKTNLQRSDSLIDKIIKRYNTLISIDDSKLQSKTDLKNYIDKTLEFIGKEIVSLPKDWNGYLQECFNILKNCIYIK